MQPSFPTLARRVKSSAPSPYRLVQGSGASLRGEWLYPRNVSKFDTKGDRAFEIAANTEWARLLEPGAQPGGVTRPDGREVWLVEDLVTGKECSALLAAAEQLGFGSTSYSKDYRGNLRLTARDQSLADAMWRRLEPLLDPSLALGAQTWRAIGLNPCWRLSKYYPGDRFARHIDYSVDKSTEEKSMLTVNIYLNDDFEAGSTRFFSDRQVPDADLTVQPRRGLCLLFRQTPGKAYIHDGERVRSGLKYLLRSDVMYRKQA